MIAQDNAKIMEKGTRVRLKKDVMICYGNNIDSAEIVVKTGSEGFIKSIVPFVVCLDKGPGGKLFTELNLGTGFDIPGSFEIIEKRTPLQVVE